MVSLLPVEEFPLVIKEIPNAQYSSFEEECLDLKASSSEVFKASSLKTIFLNLTYTVLTILDN